MQKVKFSQYISYNNLVAFSLDVWVGWSLHVCACSPMFSLCPCTAKEA